MKKSFIALSAAAVLVCPLFASNFDLSVSGSDRGVSGFALSVGEYYHAPIEEVRVIRRSIPAEELSVVYYLARKAHKHPDYITKMRIDGRSWWDIAVALRLDPQIVYVQHAPKGKAYGYYKTKKHDRLRDVEIVEIVNTRFLSSYHKVSADEIYERRQGGRGYDAIDDDYRGKKHGKEESRKQGDGEKHRHDNGKGHGKDRD